MDITPDLSAQRVPLGGYTARGGKTASGVRDPVFARALALDDGETRIALVSCDLLTIPASLTEAVLARLPGWDAARLTICATHTHCAPDSQRLNRRMRFPVPGIATFDEAALDRTADRVAEAVRQASVRTRPVTMWVGSAEAGLSRVRHGSPPLAVREIGGPPWLARWTKPAPDEDRVRVAELRGEEGVVAFLVNYAAHPTIFGEEMLRISAEWPGEVERALERAHPGAVALFLNGALGDRSPVADDGATDEERLELYAGRVRRAVEAARLVERPVDGRIEALSAVVDLPAPRPHPELVADMRRQGLPEALVASAVKGFSPTQARCTVYRIGAWTLAAVPGEPTTRVGEEVRRVAGGDAVVVGFANDWVGYVLTPEEYANGAYEATVSFHGPGLAEAILSGFRKAMSASPQRAAGAK